MFDEIRDSVTPAKAAQMLGVHIGTIHRWMMNGVRGRILPSVLVGGRRRILVSQLEAYLSTGGTAAGDLDATSDEAKKRHSAAVDRLRCFGVRIAPDRRG